MTSVQIGQSTDDICHIVKLMPAIKQTVLYTTGKLRKERPSENAPRSKRFSTKEFACTLSVEEKDAISLEGLQNRIPVISQSTGRRSTNLHPPSPCFGVSEECLAMANACSHDHDYSSRSPKMSTSRSESNDIFRKITISPTVIIKKHPGDTYESSFAGSNGFTRKPGTTTQHRPRRIVIGRKTSNDFKNVTELHKHNNRSKIPSPPESRNSEGGNSRLGDRHRGSTINQTPVPDRDCSFDLKMPNVSIPNEKIDEFQIDVMSPRLSITPFPPAQRRRTYRRASSTPCQKYASEESPSDVVEIKKEPEEILDEPCKNSVDSAYNSLTCSSSSKPRTLSGNRPASGGKRSATCGLSSSSSSGASSEEWSDIETPRRPEPSDGERTSVANVNKNCKNVTKEDDSGNKAGQKNACLPTHTHSRISSGKRIRKQCARVNLATADTSSNANDKVQYTPAPPSRKPKKGKYYRSIPMKLRALPTSFWKEPNCTNSSHYTILPPVQPLFHQHENEDIADIRPVTPPNEKDPARQAISAVECDRQRHRTIIRTGDTDLLLRLFDKVETKQNQTGIRAKRGRPKRPSYCATPSSRRGQNDNPCIMNSITEKLFPKLSLDNHHPIAAMMTLSGMLASTLPIRPTTESSHDEPKLSHVSKLTTGPIDQIANAYLADNSPSASLNYAPDEAMDMPASSPSSTLQPRPSPILPQLVGPKEYLHLLNELAAVL